MTEYEQILASRAALNKELEGGGVEDLSGEMEESAGADDVRKSRMSLDQQALDANKAQGGGQLEKAGQTTTAASGGNPYVAGAGLALQTVGAVDSAQRQAEQAKIDAYNKKIMAQRLAIRNIFA